MKKYLMSGVAALALCAAFTSCSKNEELFDQGAVNQNTADQVVEKYNQAFLKYVGGTIDPEQTWGFGGYSAGTRGATPNANQWAQKYLVPDPLTEGQIERVTRYFQSHPNLGYKDPEWSNYFMQQVYKGGGTKRNDSQWCTSEKDEWYTSANNGNVVGSDHMDHLIAKSKTGETDHIFNFNNGTCSENKNVGDNGAALDTKQHTDRIQLMENSYTYTFTYGSSDASMVRERRCALVAASVIDEWGDANGVGSKVDDKWHRSFMGFDFEQRVSDEIFEKDQSSADGFKYATIGDAPNGKSLVWDGTQVRNYNDIKNELLTDFDGNPVRMLINETNMYCGTNGDVDQNDLYTKKNLKNPETGHYQDYDVLDLTVLKQKIADGYYPVESSTLCKWVKPEGGADGYYSDWIVTLSEAQPVNQPDPDDVCIIAEDLNAESATDFDFNDVVFTVHYTSNTAAEIEVIAAGATQLIKIGKSESSAQEVHQLFADANNNPSLATPDPTTGLYKMINTGAKADVNGLTHPKFNLVVDKSKRGDDVEIWVNKFEKVSEGVYKDVNNWIRLTATKGTPAAKLCVGVDFKTKYCDERESIKEKYPMFYNWIKDHPTLIWWY